MKMNGDIIRKHCRLHQQDASNISLLKVLYVGRRKTSNDKPIICHCSRLKPVDPQKSELEKRAFLHELGFLSYLKPLQMISVIMNDEVPLSLFKTLVRGENDFHFLSRQHLFRSLHMQMSWTETLSDLWPSSTCSATLFEMRAIMLENVGGWQLHQ